MKFSTWETENGGGEIKEKMGGKERERDHHQFYKPQDRRQVQNPVPSQVWNC